MVWDTDKERQKERNEVMIRIKCIFDEEIINKLLNSWLRMKYVFFQREILCLENFRIFFGIQNPL